MQYTTIDVVLGDATEAYHQPIGQINLAWIETDLYKWAVIKSAGQPIVDIRQHGIRLFSALVNSHPLNTSPLHRTRVTLENTRFIVDTADKDIAQRFLVYRLLLNSGAIIGVSMKQLSPSMVDGVMQHHLIAT